MSKRIYDLRNIFLYENLLCLQKRWLQSTFANGVVCEKDCLHPDIQTQLEGVHTEGNVIEVKLELFIKLQLPRPERLQTFVHKGDEAPIYNKHPLRSRPIARRDICLMFSIVMNH
jgi:hypothetical protein